MRLPHVRWAKLTIILAFGALLTFAWAGKTWHEELLAQGQKSFDAGDFKSAEKSFVQAARVVPVSWEAHGRLGLTLKRLNQDDEALDQLNWAILLGGRDRRFYVTRGAIYYLKGEFGAAEKDFQASLKQDPNYVWGNYWMANVLVAGGRASEALLYAEKAASSDPRLAGFVDQVKAANP